MDIFCGGCDKLTFLFQCFQIQPPVYEENSCLYLFTRENLLKRHHRIGEHPLMFEIDAAEAWDIDEELDFAITDFLMQHKK